MLKEFWEAKKHLIQLVGILTGIGALFLSITLPENIQAKQALINIQFVWLIIITICLLLLFINFIRLADFWEKSFKEKSKIDYTDTISIFFSGTLIYLIINLWVYMISLYKESFWNYLTMVNYALLSLFGALFVQIWRKIEVKIPENPPWKRGCYLVLFKLILSFSLGFFLLLVFHHDSFSFLTAVILSCGFYIVIALYSYQRSLKSNK